MFAIACACSLLVTVCVPVLYYFKNREILTQGAWQQLEENDVEVSGMEFEEVEVEVGFWDRERVAFLLTNSSLLINLNYFSLWMMEPIGSEAETSYQQYNITIEMVSAFFMLSSVGYFVGSRFF